ncbi:MAG TPA: DUF4350 domain-containing protein [Microcella sp.]|nr:DUF4350 domain-containing protein [Microcella sp.]
MSATVLTPSVGRTVRRSLFWAGAAGVSIALALGLTALNGVASSTDRWDPRSAAPRGSLALTTVLADEGIMVELAATRAEVDAAIDAARRAGETVTLLVADGRALLDGESVASLAGLADRLVLAEPAPDALDALGFPFSTSRPTSGPIEVGTCALPAAERAGTIDGDAIVLYETEADEQCAVVDGAAALLTQSRDGAEVIVLGAGEALENGAIDRAGNAALALGLTGAHPRLVWYSPSPADVGLVTLADVTPGWVNPLAWTAIAALLAAAFWRGRRLGPVVIENLPVVVKTTETMEGRARLYARGGARLRALDALRVGTLRRLSATLALGTAAGVDDIVAAAASTTGRDLRSTRELLVDAEPANDTELMRYSESLIDLEQAVSRRVALDDDSDTPERMTG